MAFQQLTVEFQVFGALDGSTPAPKISRDPTSPDYIVPDARGIIVVPVQGNLGLIDLDLSGGTATRGPRCIPWLYLDSPVPGEAFSTFGVLDANPGPGVPVPQPQSTGPVTGGIPEFYSESPVCVAMGSVFGVFGYPATIQPKLLRINIVGGQDSEEQALIDQACCCLKSTCSPENGNSPVITAISGTLSAAPDQVLTVDGANLGTILTLTDLGVVIEPLRWLLIEQPVDGLEAQVFEGTVTSQATLEQSTVTFNLSAARNGLYWLVGYDPDDAGCNTAASASTQGSFLPFVPLGQLPGQCPSSSQVTGQTVVNQGANGRTATVEGVGFQDGDNIVITADLGLGTLTVTDVTFVESTEINFTYNADGSPGLYTVQVERIGCPSASLPGAIQVNLV